MSTYLIARTVVYGPSGGRVRKHQIRNQVLDIVDGGPCLTPPQFPVTSPDGDRVASVPCGRRLPSAQECDACRVTVEIVEEHRVVLGAEPADTYASTPSANNRAPATAGAV